MTDSEAVSETNTENSGDAGALSDGEYEGAGGELHPAAEKIATVCNEIKQRFQTERLNTDDENAIWKFTQTYKLFSKTLFLNEFLDL